MPSARKALMELEFNIRWGDLATYNSEKARGVVHTSEWVEQMRVKQERYNAILRAGGDLLPGDAYDPAEDEEVQRTMRLARLFHIAFWLALAAVIVLLLL
jgi:hypothetical protein